MAVRYKELRDGRKSSGWLAVVLRSSARLVQSFLWLVEMVIFERLEIWTNVMRFSLTIGSCKLIMFFFVPAKFWTYIFLHLISILYEILDYF